MKRNRTVYGGPENVSFSREKYAFCSDDVKASALAVRVEQVVNQAFGKSSRALVRDTDVANITAQRTVQWNFR